MFDKVVNRIGTKSTKWDKMEMLFGVNPDNGLAMWIADSDYPTAPCVIDVVSQAAEHGIFGYSWEYPEYLKAIQWWMKTRHNWNIDTYWVLTSQGLGNAIALCLDLWSKPGDGVVIFTPVYHEFALKIKRSGRKVVECPLVREAESYMIDFEDAQKRLTGAEKILLWSSPQNPSGRIWSQEELISVAEFSEKNGLILVSDEIHHDLVVRFRHLAPIFACPRPNVEISRTTSNYKFLVEFLNLTFVRRDCGIWDTNVKFTPLVYPGHHFIPMDVAAPNARHRTITLTSASKTFNIAGQRTGNMIIPCAKLRTKMKLRLEALDYSPNALGVNMVRAAYTPQGASWVDAQIAYLNENRKRFDKKVNEIIGFWSMPLQSTYLAWVEFSKLGLSADEFDKQLRTIAKIAASSGTSFGSGGENFCRFNLAAPHAVIHEACNRLKSTFSG